MEFIKEQKEIKKGFKGLRLLQSSVMKCSNWKPNGKRKGRDFSRAARPFRGQLELPVMNTKVEQGAK
jgi:hypothetical protein